MVRTALKFIEAELGRFMFERDRASYTAADQIALATGLTKRDGTPTIDEKHIHITLTHFEEERTESKRPYLHQDPDTKKYHQLQPPIKLNLYVLFSAVKNDYPTALRDLSLVILFFQRYNVFTEDKFPHLNDEANNGLQKPWQRIEELSFWMYTMTYEQQSYLWSSLGSKYLPSVLYKMSLLVAFDQTSEKEITPILETTNNHN